MKQDDEAPIRVAQQAFEAFEGRQWDRFVEMIDAPELERMRDGELARLTAWAQYRPDLAARTGGSVGFTHDHSPDPKLLARFRDTHIRSFRGNPTLGELAELSPRAFVTEVLMASYDGGGPRPLSFHRECLGVVFEDEILAHVVCRAGPPEMSGYPWRVSISSLKRGPDGQWRVLPSWDLLAAGGMMHALFDPPAE